MTFGGSRPEGRAGTDPVPRQHGPGGPGGPDGTDGADRRTVRPPLSPELEALVRERVEERVAQRTVELERSTQDIRRLAGLGNLLQSCESLAGAYELAAFFLADLFPGLDGSVYAWPSGDEAGTGAEPGLRRAAEWGRPDAPATLRREDCWALRRGGAYVVGVGETGPRCPHLPDDVRRAICVPMATQDHTTGLLVVSGRDTIPAPRPSVGPAVSQRELVMAAGEQIALAVSHLELRGRLEEQALRDPLTGLYNRRFVGEWMEREVERCARAGSTLGVMMLDLDRFKALNDRFGHDAGDQMIVAVAGVLRRGLRSNDVPSRYGGEEFLALLSDIDLPTLRQRADALRLAVADVEVEHRGQLLPAATLSVGISLYPDHGATTAELLRAADTALYVAKNSGRNQIRTAEE